MLEGYRRSSCGMLEEYRRGAGGRGGMLEGYIGEVEVGGVGCWRSIGEVKVGGEDVGGSLVPSPSAPPVLIACSMQKRRGKAWGIFSCDTRHDRHMLSRGLTISRNGTDRNGPEHHTIPRNGHASSRRSSYTAQCAHENLLVGVRNEAAMMGPRGGSRGGGHRGPVPPPFASSPLYFPPY